MNRLPGTRTLPALLAASLAACSGAAAPAEAGQTMASAPASTAAVPAAGAPVTSATVASESATDTPEALSTVQVAELAALTERAAAQKQRITELADMLGGDWDGEKVFEFHEVQYDANGEPFVTRHKVSLTAEEAAALRKALDTQLTTLTDMSEMDQFDLQRLYKDYQAGIDTLSTILENLELEHASMLDNLDDD